ncbi:semaphorin-4C isoform X2 [Rhinatrema bivittatum]|uniref:semaphorin-4C isoform X2 n=1 Tax=Rhinatrema bivittatum TaxID=194408 RepID=UPI00112D67D0|nr:semaphorin-4C isoform X2 [Rhinatrema bivittatum]
MLGPEVLAAGLWAVMALLSTWTKAMEWNSVARKTVHYKQLEAERFSRPGIHNYKTLTLDESEGVLFVGAQEAIFALSLSSITKELKPAIFWEAPLEKKLECILKGKNNKTECFNYIRFLQSYNASHMYTCGTYAFQPKCTYIELSSFTLDRFSLEDGKGKCPYDPSKGHSGLIVDGALYSATLNNFLGTEPVILRNLGQHHAMKSEYLASWFNEPNFVGSAYVQESVGSATGDDDKIYFFFSERAVEYDCYAEQAVARVARVCKGDVGGARTLQKKWTSFLKARMICSVPEHQLHFNRVQAMYTLSGNTWRDTQFFGVFQACCGEVSMSAICQYTIEDVQKVFEGPYKEYREQDQKWAQYSDQVPNPRPGACITDWHRENGFHSSLELPDSTLNFAKKHPLMDGYVLPRQHKPLLVKKEANFTQLVVDRVRGLSGEPYDVLFIGTENGWLYKAVNLGSRVHVVEELQLFEHSHPIESLTISHKKKLLFAGSYSQVVQLSVADCSKYHSCNDCILAKDPYCAWNRNASRCMQVNEHDRSLLIQDVMSSDTALCNDPVQKTVRITPKNITVGMGTTVLLPCRLPSNLALARWTFNGKELTPERDAILADSVLYDSTLKVLLILEADIGHSGSYSCSSEEQGMWLVTEGYYLSVVASLPLTLEASAPLENLGLMWMVVIALGAVCLVLFLLVLYLRQKLKNELEKSSKSIESTLVYPVELPKEPKSPDFIPSTMSDSDEKLWDPASYYYSDGSLKIVPGHAVCQNGGSSPSPTSNGIPGQPIPTTALHSPNRINLGNIRGSNSNGYIRLNLGIAEERPDYSDVTEELRWKLKQRQALPDSNPEESSV